MNPIRAALWPDADRELATPEVKGLEDIAPGMARPAADAPGQT
jgi:hypothetical protein